MQLSILWAQNQCRVADVRYTLSDKILSNVYYLKHFRRLVLKGLKQSYDLTWRLYQILEEQNRIRPCLENHKFDEKHSQQPPYLKL